MFKKTAFLNLAAFCLVLFSCGNGRDGIVRVGLNNFTGDLPFFVAIEKGFFNNGGLKIETTTFGNSTEALNALLAGRVDVINPISFSALFAADIKDPGQFKAFLAGGENSDIIGSYLLVAKNSNIRILEDLKNKTIGTYTGATQLLYLKLFLKNINYDPEIDVKIVQVDPNLQGQALEASQFDALFTVEPYATIIINKGIARVLVENPRVKYIVNPFISGAAAASTKFIKNNPDAMRKFVGAIDAAIDFIRNNEAESRAILGMEKYTPLAAASSNSGLLKWYKSDEALDASAIQKIADLLYSNGLLDKKIAITDIFISNQNFNTNHSE